MKYYWNTKHIRSCRSASLDINQAQYSLLKLFATEHMNHLVKATVLARRFRKIPLKKKKKKNPRTSFYIYWIPLRKLVTEVNMHKIQQGLKDTSSMQRSCGIWHGIGVAYTGDLSILQLAKTASCMLCNQLFGADISKRSIE